MQRPCLGQGSHNLSTKVIHCTEHSPFAALPSAGRQTTQGGDIVSVTTRALHKHLSGVAKAKRDNHPPTEIAFHPIILSAGGVVEKATRSILSTIKPKLGPGAFSQMLQNISIGLVRSQAAVLARIEGNPLLHDLPAIPGNPATPDGTFQHPVDDEIEAAAEFNEERGAEVEKDAEDEIEQEDWWDGDDGPVVGVGEGGEEDMLEGHMVDGMLVDEQTT